MKYSRARGTLRTAVSSLPALDSIEERLEEAENVDQRQ